MSKWLAELATAIKLSYCTELRYEKKQIAIVPYFFIIIHLMLFVDNYFVILSYLNSSSYLSARIKCVHHLRELTVISNKLTLSLTKCSNHVLVLTLVQIVQRITDEDKKKIKQTLNQ